MKITRSITAVVLAVITLALFAACSQNAGKADETTASNTESSAIVWDLGEGDTTVAVVVTMADGTANAFNVHTNQTNLGEALREAELIACDVQGMVKSVDGVSADYVQDKAYWAFYIDGEYAAHGVNDETITAGRVYAFTYTPA